MTSPSGALESRRLECTPGTAKDRTNRMPAVSASSVTTIGREMSRIESGWRDSPSCSGQAHEGYNDSVSSPSIRMPEKTLAVIDIGSNTSRVSVFRMNGDGHYETVADSRAALQLLRGLSANGRAEAAATSALMAALSDFRSVARGAGAERIVALATYSVRGFARAQELVQRIEAEIGIQVEVIDGGREAELGFLGAIYGSDAEDGMHLDLGGGSLELTHFRKRLPLRSWSLPLGALLLNDRFLVDDPPSKSQIDALQGHVRKELRGEGVRPLKGRERLIATGGTVRNLAKLDRNEHRYPLPQSHGYTLSRRRIKDLGRRLAPLRREDLAGVRGLNPDRKDSIVAGALALYAILRVLEAEEAQVSGQGLREGYALSTCLRQLPPARSVRRVAVEALAHRFATWDLRAAQRRGALAAALQAILDREASQEMQEALLHAAWIVDIGKSIDYVDRFHHAASVLMTTDLAGFSHRQIALLAATVEAADKRKPDWRSYRPLLSNADDPPLEKTGLLLALADEIEKRLPPDSGIPMAFHDVHRAHIGVDLPAPYGGRLATLAERFSQVFGWELVFEGGR